MGAHVSFKKDTQLLGSIEQLLEINGTSGAIYIGNSRSYSTFWEINDELTLKGKKLAEKNNINIENIIVHSPLLLNLANVEKEYIKEQSIKASISDIKRMDRVGLVYYNLHPGSFPDANLGIKSIAESINLIHKETSTSKTIILFETMMKKGNYIGKNFDQISEIISLINNKDRIGVCLDTCHVWDGGYDIKNNLDEVIREFDDTIGINRLKGLHINDSKNELGSGKDRHENIGKGFIGLQAIKSIVNNKHFKHLPKALETPNKQMDLDIWKKEIELILDK